MAYAYMHDLACSWERYLRLGTVLDAPPGRILHLAGPTDEGVRCIDVWESEPLGRSFCDALLTPILAELGPAANRHSVLRHLYPEHFVLGASPSPRPTPCPPCTSDKEQQ